MKTSRLYFRMDPRQIGFVKFILEAYDNIAVMTTLDPHPAVVQVTVAPGGEQLISHLFADLAREFEIVAIHK